MEQAMKHSRTLGLLIGLTVTAIGVTAFIHRHDRPRDPTPVPTTEGARRIIDITARDYAFDAPDAMTPGPVTFRFTNHGPDLHHVYIVTLPDGKALADLVNGTKRELLPAWAIPVGGPGAQIPGGRGETSLTLSRGRYAIVCIIPAADGMPHLRKGMMHEFAVTGPEVRTGLPATDLTMTLRDYAFDLSAPLTAGRHLIEVRNTATQHHEVIFVRLAPGRHIGDLFAWLGDHDGPPPAAMVGGTSPFAPGVTNLVDITLEPGTYALACFATDVHDGKMHLMHGMSTEFTI
jgi:hypothetical protein